MQQSRKLPGTSSGHDSDAPASGIGSALVEGSGRSAALSLRGISKAYVGVQALDGVSLDVLPGEVHGLVGENGAGKSTLVGVAAGTVVADGGEVWLGTARLERADPSLARERGLAIVHQEPALMPDLTVAENLVLGAKVEQRPKWRQAREWAGELLSGWTSTRSIDPGAYVRDLSPDQRFIVELSKACAHDPAVLILDEPTEHLLADDVGILFSVIRRLAARGTAVVYISHHIGEVLEVCDRIGVLRDGILQGVVEAADASYDSIVTHIVGRQLEAEFPEKRPTDRPLGPAVLAVGELSGAGFENVSFSVHAGEVVGLAGVEGNGQREVIQAIAGVLHSSGTVRVRDRLVGRGSTPDAARRGIAFVPNDRHREGILSGLGVRENIAVGNLASVSKWGMVQRRRERKAVGERVDALRIATPSLDAPVENLSGGNQQKVVFGRALQQAPHVLVADEPTQGVDVGARAEIYSLIRESLGDDGAAVVVSSSQVELEGLCDRVLVFSRGRMVRQLTGEDVTEQAIIEAALTAEGPRREGSARKHGRGIRKFLGSDAAAPIVTLAAVLLLAGFVTMRNGAFLSDIAISGMLMVFAAFAFAGLAQQVVMLVGGIDLSIGPLMGFLCVVASFYIIPGVGVGQHVLGLMVMLGIALGVAVVNVAPTLVGISPMLTTLVTFTALQGFSFLLRPVPGGQLDLGVLDALATTVGPVPVAAVVAVVIGLAFDVVLRRTTWGVALRAVGSSERYAHAAGIKVALMQVTAYVVAGLMVFLAALMLMNQVGTGHPSAGVSYTLFSITAVVVGGASIAGGRGLFVGALSGALLIVIINSAVTFLNLSTAWQTYMLGLLTLAAAGVYSHFRSSQS